MLPAFKRLEVFLSETYLLHARKGNGVSSMENFNGDNYYNALLEYSTTLKMVNATEFYTYGYAQLEKSQKRLVELAEELDFGQNLTVKKAIDVMYKSKRMYFDTAEEVLETYESELEQIKMKLSTVFEDEILTNRVLDVKPLAMDKGRLGIAYFAKASSDGRRKGKSLFYQ